MDYIISTSSWPKKENVSKFLNNLRVRMYTTFSCRDVHYKWQDIGGDFWVFLKWTKQTALLAITASRSISWVVFSVPSYSELVHSIISIFFVEIRIFKDFFSSNHGLYFVCCQRLFSQKNTLLNQRNNHKKDFKWSFRFKCKYIDIYVVSNHCVVETYGQ